MKKLTAGKLRSGCPHQKATIGVAALLVLSALTVVAPYLSAAKDKKNRTEETSKATKGLPVHDVTEEEAILQALNRLGFGPRPGDLERVKEMGLQKWIDRQLHPESIDDAALDARLERFPTLKMSSAKLLEEFPEPQVAARREGITVEEYRKEQMEQMRPGMQSSAQGENQSGPAVQPQGGAQGVAPTDVQMADSMHMPDFEAVDNDLNANPAKEKGPGKGPGGFGNRMINYEQIRLP